jgi:hypothetical protein
LCDRCAVRDECDYYRSLGAKAVPRAANPAVPGRKAGAVAAKTPGAGRGGGAPRLVKK